MPNAGFLVGHSAIRRVVMKDAATEREATAAELEQMKALLRDGTGGRRARVLLDVVDLAQRPPRPGRAVTVVEP